MKPESTYTLLARFMGANDASQTKAQKAAARKQARWLAKELAKEGLKVVRK